MRKIDYFMSNPDSIADAIDEFLNVQTDYFSCETIGELVARYLLMDNDSNTVVATDKEDDAVKCDLFKTVTKPENYHTPADTLDFGAFSEDRFDFNTSVANNIIEKYGAVVDGSIIRHIWDNDCGAVREITLPKIDDDVSFIGDDGKATPGHITAVSESDGELVYEITSYFGGTFSASKNSFITIYIRPLPWYKYMYVLTVSPEHRQEFIKALSLHGFRVYAVDGIGYVFGYDTHIRHGKPTKQDVDKAFHNVLMYLEDNNDE